MSCCSGSGPAFAYATPAEAVAALLAELEPVSTERVPLEQVAGRVLAQPLRSDRPSPPCDVSAMDGYALRLADLREGPLNVAGEVHIGQRPPALPEGRLLRIVTGAPVPAEAEAVVRREDFDERGDTAILRIPPSDVQPGAHIRRQGENAPAEATVTHAGTVVTPAVAAALAAFGCGDVEVRRQVRVGVLVTGDELVDPDQPAQPWQIRDSNTAALRAMLAGPAWVALLPPRRAVDKLDAITAALAGLLEDADAVLLTGGVSMGDYDHVPAAVAAAGGRTLFHKLPVRPGKPVLGAVGPRGQTILGLPGNPVSVMCTARRMAAPALRRQAGLAQPEPSRPLVRLENPPARTLDLWWSQPVRLLSDGRAERVKSMGSGDIAAAAGADGFVQMPPGAQGPGPWPYYDWTWT